MFLKSLSLRANHLFQNVEYKITLMICLLLEQFLQFLANLMTSHTFVKWVFWKPHHREIHLNNVFEKLHSTKRWFVDSKSVSHKWQFGCETIIPMCANVSPTGILSRTALQMKHWFFVWYKFWPIDNGSNELNMFWVYQSPQYINLTTCLREDLVGIQILNIEWTWLIQIWSKIHLIPICSFQWLSCHSNSMQNQYCKFDP